MQSPSPHCLNSNVVSNLPDIGTENSEGKPNNCTTGETNCATSGIEDYLVIRNEYLETRLEAISDSNERDLHKRSKERGIGTSKGENLASEAEGSLLTPPVESLMIREETPTISIESDNQINTPDGIEEYPFGQLLGNQYLLRMDNELGQHSFNKQSESSCKSLKLSTKTNRTIRTAATVSEHLPTTMDAEIASNSTGDTRKLNSVMHGMESGGDTFFIDTSKSNGRSFHTLDSEVHENRNNDIETEPLESTGAELSISRYESLNVCNLPEHSIVIRDTMPPTYKSMSTLILEDEPPKYETVTGKSLGLEQELESDGREETSLRRDNDIGNTPQQRPVHLHVSTCRQKLICITLVVIIAMIVVAAKLL